MSTASAPNQPQPDSSRGRLGRGESEFVLEAVGLSRSFGPIEVLGDVSLDVCAGEVHAIIGENGAGKSTLMKILSGHLSPTRGALKLDGAAVDLAGPVDAERRGIVLVHQEIMLAPDLTIAENMFLGREIRRGLVLDDREMNRRAFEAMRVFGVEAPVNLPVERLSIAQRQLAQIARALTVPHRVVIFDEPTASLTPVETAALLRLIGDLKARGVAILYISHRLEEVKAVADVVTVLRDGKKVATRPAAGLEPVDMARLMVGRDLLALYPPRVAAPSAAPFLDVAGFGADGFAEDASFSVRPGEILGFSGLVGAGRTELFEALFGLRKGAGAIRLDGKPQQWRDARAAMRAGAVYLTEDRKGKGLLLEETLATNLTLAALDGFQRGPVVDRAGEARALDTAIQRFDIRVGDKGLNAGQMSGGNQQKLLLAKMMLLDPRVVVIDEPTRGIDIGAKQQIYRFIAAMAGEGRSVIVISSEMAELIGVCHRIIVMRNGRIAGEVEGEAMTEHAIVVLATGVDATAGEAAT
ncbi:monosaccharide ABC transporter ATP-binding protein (CUT2 family) [Roseiarcus fermentans]|uniref:Monosaccharide ABC transporter ATP-binding protein (CUT2 family) n=1 Tax=Roseiarcus fermentans TaxID=1473586 RepID=A0A366ETC3_9HYPH|nr:sugar ABC transporter ATP-binding protein [Roseiarcus fermentans]RBP05647.1 monosaccharide ABC transporter ATP-binding protein (CUT2 family) [Roseiarcus fermentans]